MRTLGSPVLFLKGEKKAGHGRCTVSPTSARGQQTTASQNGRQPSEGQKREVLDYIVDVLQYIETGKRLVYYSYFWLS